MKTTFVNAMNDFFPWCNHVILCVSRLPGDILAAGKKTGLVGERNIMLCENEKEELFSCHVFYN